MTGTAAAGAPVGVLCLGPVGIDLLIDSGRPVDPGLLTEDWVSQVGVEVRPAGSAAYVAQALTHLGTTVRLAATRGEDLWGEQTTALLAARGVPIDEIESVEGPTNLAIYLRLFGSRKRPLLVRPGSPTAWPGVVEPAPSRAIIASGGLHFPDHARRTLPRQLERCRRAGLLTVVDPQFPLETTPNDPSDLAEVLAHTDLLCCDAAEGRHLFGATEVAQMVQRAHEAGCEQVVVKLGRDGVVFSAGGSLGLQPAAASGPAQAEIGAGDAFLAGTVTALIDGRDLAGAVAHGAAVAAVAADRRGFEGLNPASVDEVLSRVPAARPFHPTSASEENR